MSRHAVAWLLALFGVALAGPWLAPYDADREFADALHAPPMPLHLDGLRPPVAHPVVLADRLEQRYTVDEARTVPLPWIVNAPDAAPVFLLGADSYGRDVLSRLLHGARASIGLALAATLGALWLGALAGAWAGYRGGWVDEAVMRLADLIVVLPVIYCVVVLRAALPLVLSASVVFSLMTGIFVAVGWPHVARGVRAIVRAERHREYVVAALACGASPGAVLVRHLLPACGEYLIAQAGLLLPAFILAEATLSFVGLGFPDQVASWGTMLTEASSASAMARFPWTLAPAAAIFLVVLATNTVSGSRGQPARTL